MNFWVQFCLLNVIFRFQVILCVTELDEYCAKLKIVLECGKYRPALQ